MRYYLLRLFVVIVLIIFATASFRIRSYQDSMAEAAESFSVLDFKGAGEIYGKIAEDLGKWRLAEFVLSRWVVDIDDRRNEVRYWQKDYGHLGEVLYEAERGGDSVLSKRTEFVAVDALYRNIGPEADKETVVKELVGIADRYKKIVDDDSDNFDAAFNYEYLTRLIEDLRKGRRELPLDFSGGEAVHGAQGEPIDLEGAGEIKIFVPKGEDNEDDYSPGDAPRKKG